MEDKSGILRRGEVLRYDGRNFLAGFIIGMFILSSDAPIWLPLISVFLLIRLPTMFDFNIASYSSDEGWRFLYKKSAVKVN